MRLPSTPALRRPAWVRSVLVVVVAVASAAAAVGTWGATGRDVGPLRAEVGLAVGWSGGARIVVPPLGRLSVPTHAAPVQVRATVTAVRPDRARALLAGDRPTRTVVEEVAADARSAVTAAAVRAVAVALLAASLVSFLVFRRRRDVLLGAGAVVLTVTASGAVAAATFDSDGLTQPTFTGLLAHAPDLVGNVESFDAYGQRVAELTANVTSVYGGIGRSGPGPDDQATRVLWVSDVHNNPQAFRVMRELVAQFDAQAIVDTGDITDLGSSVENRGLAAVGRLDVPYLWVRGNHDTRTTTQAYLETLPNVTVLDGTVAEVAGLRVAGTGDPLYAPNRRPAAQQEANRRALRRAGERLAQVVDRSEAVDDEPVDLALVHEPAMAVPLDGRVPLVLSGHTHERDVRTSADTVALTQGTSGGAGLRAFDEGAPQPLELSVLSFDGTTGRLLAVDDITVGGVGERRVTVQRRAAVGEGSAGDRDTAEHPPG